MCALVCSIETELQQCLVSSGISEAEFDFNPPVCPTSLELGKHICGLGGFYGTNFRESVPPSPMQGTILSLKAYDLGQQESSHVKPQLQHRVH